MLRRLCRLPYRRLLSVVTGRMEGGGVKVEKKGSCAILRMCLGENRLNPNFVKAYNQALDKIESDEEITCMVSIGEGKHYSLGLDLDHMATMHAMELMEFSDDMQFLFARMLTFPIPSVAAINGHIYAAGVFIALSQDYSVMRTDRGWFCLPEVNIKRHFSAGVLELVKARLPVREHHVAIALGKRYTAEEAKAAGIVNEVSSLDVLEEKAIAAARRFARKEGLDRKVFSTIKQDLYRDQLRVLREPTRFYSNL